MMISFLLLKKFILKTLLEISCLKTFVNFANNLFHLKNNKQINYHLFQNYFFYLKKVMKLKSMKQIIQKDSKFTLTRSS